MKVNACSLLPLIVVILLVAACVNADRAHVEKIKGAPKNLVKIQGMPRANAKRDELPKVVQDDVKTAGSKSPCSECMDRCEAYCVNSSDPICSDPSAYCGRICYSYCTTP